MNNPTTIGIGTWQLGGPITVGGQPAGYGDASLADGTETVKSAIDAGHNFIDTAYAYGNGIALRTIAASLKTINRGAYQICSKAGLLNGHADFSVSSLSNTFNDTLSLLNTSYLDYFLLHNPADDFEHTAELTEWIHELLEAGRILNFGVSVNSVYGVEHHSSQPFVNAIEVICNAFDTRAINARVASEVSLIARSPYASGFLINTYEKSSLSQNDWRSAMNEQDFTALRNASRIFHELSEKLESPASVLALRYLLASEKVEVIIPGVRNKTQLHSILQAAEAGPLNSEEVAIIDAEMPDLPKRWLK